MGYLNDYLCVWSIVDSTSDWTLSHLLLLAVSFWTSRLYGNITSNVTILGI